MQKKPLLILVFILVFITLISYILYFKEHATERNIRINEKSKYIPTYTSLKNEDPSFSEADDLLESGHPAEAIELFKKSLLASDSNEKKALVEYKISVALEANNNYRGAIENYVKIISSPFFPKKTKGYSCLRVSKMASSHPEASKEIEEMVTTTAPFKEAYAQSKTSNISAGLNDYCLSLYPNLVSIKTEIASRKARTLYLNKEKLPTSQIKNDVDYISSLIQNVDQDVLDLQTIPDEKWTVPDVYMNRALAFGYITAIKGDNDSESLLLLKRALEYSLVSVKMESKHRYSLAVFLATVYGNKKSLEIHEILKPYYTDAQFKNSIRARSIIAEKNNQIGYKDTVVLLASIDSDFKTFLLGNGWEEKDFLNNHR